MPVTLYPRIRCTDKDARAFSHTIQRSPLEAEHFVHDAYLDRIIQKPWGHEYRVYADTLYDVWKLCLFPGQATSMHCHPRKETALLCLRGTAKVRFLGATHIVRALDGLHIGKGVWHATTNIGPDDLELIEVETPRNKLDLVRMADRYGRALTQYEQSTQSADAPLHPAHVGEGAKLRHYCLHHRYRFEVSTGKHIVSFPQASFLFLVSLGIQDALEHTIHVASRNHLPQALDMEKNYLVITQEKEVPQR